MEQNEILNGTIVPVQSLGGVLDAGTLGGNVACYSTLSGALAEDGSISGALSNPILRGYSAYAIAVMHGFQGTEEEWLESLKPKNGEDYFIDAEEIANSVKEDLKDTFILKKEGYSLISVYDIAKLTNISPYANHVAPSKINGNILIDGKEVQVYNSLPLDDANYIKNEDQVQLYSGGAGDSWDFSEDDEIVTFKG